MRPSIVGELRVVGLAHPVAVGPSSSSLTISGCYGIVSSPESFTIWLLLALTMSSPEPSGFLPLANFLSGIRLSAPPGSFAWRL